MSGSNVQPLQSNAAYLDVLSRRSPLDDVLSVTESSQSASTLRMRSAIIESAKRQLKIYKIAVSQENITLLIADLGKITSGQTALVTKLRELRDPEWTLSSVDPQRAEELFRNDAVDAPIRTLDPVALQPLFERRVDAIIQDLTQKIEQSLNDNSKLGELIDLRKPAPTAARQNVPAATDIEMGQLLGYEHLRAETIDDVRWVLYTEIHKITDSPKAKQAFGDYVLSSKRLNEMLFLQLSGDTLRDTADFSMDFGKCCAEYYSAQNEVIVEYTKLLNSYHAARVELDKYLNSELSRERSRISSQTGERSFKLSRVVTVVATAFTMAAGIATLVHTYG